MKVAVFIWFHVVAMLLLWVYSVHECNECVEIVNEVYCYTTLFLPHLPFCIFYAFIFVFVIFFLSIWNRTHHLLINEFRLSGISISQFPRLKSHTQTHIIATVIILFVILSINWYFFSEFQFSAELPSYNGDIYKNSFGYFKQNQKMQNKVEMQITSFEFVKNIWNNMRNLLLLKWSGRPYIPLKANGVHKAK